MSLTGNWSYPTEMRFGAGIIQELGEACSRIGRDKPLLVTDRILSKLPLTQRVINILGNAGLKTSLFSEVDPNPTDVNLKDGIQEFRKGSYNGIIALGGGSALDLGKLIAFMAGQTRSIWEFEDTSDNWTRAKTSAILPIVAVPTTAGTGSEVGRASVVMDSENGVKKLFSTQKLCPVL